MAKYDVLVLGEINVDLILTADEITPVPGQERLVDDMALTMGSSSVIFACGAAELGLRVGFVGVVGDDEFGRFMLRGMAARGIDVTPVQMDPKLKTGITVSLSTPADRAMLTYAGSIAALTAEHVDRTLLNEARHVHVSSFYLQEGLRKGLPELLAQARKGGLTVSLDTGYDPREVWDGGLQATLAQVNVLMPNEIEAAALAGTPDPQAALRTLAQHVPVVAVKLGAQGAVAQRGSEVVQAAPPAVEARDTTGAGDSFDAGFVYGFLAGWPLEQTLRLACACGALTTRIPGGTNGQPTLDEALAALERGQAGNARQTDQGEPQ
jgi:sugar/nucleoside kinase (ribokinase family)